MKRIFVLLIALLMIAVAAGALAYTEDAVGAENTPQSIRDFLAESRWAGWEITGWAEPGTYKASSARAFVAVKQGRTNDLLAFRFDPESGRYVYAWHNAAALPQVEEPIVLALYGDGGGQPRFEARYEDGEAYRLHSYWAQEENGVWNLQTVEIYDPPMLMFIDTAREGLIRYTDAGWGELANRRSGKVYGRYQRDLRYFSFSAFPLTLENAREKLSNPPKIPGGTLYAKEVKFTSGQKYPVYIGPGEEYGRAAGGKASVSTNDWIQVFGEENGYIMIQYDISSEKMRIGFIDASALPKKAAVEELVYEPVDAWTTERAKLTDDPLGAQTALATIAKDTQLLWLATMGDWAYVEIDAEQLLRGFVRAEQLSMDGMEK